MNHEEFSKYTSIMYNTDSDNKVVKKMKEFYYNRNLMKLSDRELEKVEEMADLQNIKNTIILEENIGNLYEYIKNNIPKNSFDIRGYILSQYTFKPRIIYSKYSTDSSDFFNTLHQGITKYINVTSEDINKTIYTEENIYKTMTDLMRTRNGEVHSIPRTFILLDGSKNYIFDSALDSLTLSTLNGTLFDVSESDISMFFNVLANLNYYILTEKLKEFRKTLINNMENNMSDIVSLISEYKSFFNEETRDIHFGDLVTASGNLWDSISDFAQYYTISENRVYPGMYTYDAFKILEEIVTSDMFYLDSVENISLFTLYKICRGYFYQSFTDNSKVNEYNNLKKFAKEYIDLYKNIRKKIISTNQFDYTELTLDE